MVFDRVMQDLGLDIFTLAHEKPLVKDAVDEPNWKILVTAELLEYSCTWLGIQDLMFLCSQLLC